MNLFTVLSTNLDGTVKVQCPCCSGIFSEKETINSAAGCPDCGAMGYLDYQKPSFFRGKSKKALNLISNVIIALAILLVTRYLYVGFSEVIGAYRLMYAQVMFFCAGVAYVHLLQFLKKEEVKHG